MISPLILKLRDGNQDQRGYRARRAHRDRVLFSCVRARSSYTLYAMVIITIWPYSKVLERRA